MIVQHFELCRSLVGVGDDQPAIAKRTQVFAGKKAETGRIADSAGLLAVDARAERLAAIFNQL